MSDQEQFEPRYQVGQYAERRPGRAGEPLHSGEQRQPRAGVFPAPVS